MSPDIITGGGGGRNYYYTSQVGLVQITYTCFSNWSLFKSHWLPISEYQTLKNMIAKPGTTDLVWLLSWPLNVEVLRSLMLINIDASQYRGVTEKWGGEGPSSRHGLLST